MGLPMQIQQSREVHYFPDGHMGVSWDGTNNNAQILWPENVSYVTTGLDVEHSGDAYPFWAKSRPQEDSEPALRRQATVQGRRILTIAVRG
jgi:hypothetical protein